MRTAALLLAALCLGNSLAATTPSQVQTIFIDRSAYQPAPHPPSYLGASVPENTGLDGFNYYENGIFIGAPSLSDINDIKWPDNNSDGWGDVPVGVSWELNEHYVLNDLVEDLSGDPMALASYVQNEIELVRAFQKTSDDIPLESDYFSHGAYQVLLSKQGSPWEQCSLLVYLLRRAGYPAVVAESDYDPDLVSAYGAAVPPYHWNSSGIKSSMLMQADQIDRMLGFRFEETTNPNDTDIFYVNYPWVILNTEKDGSGDWVNLFPWIKDVVVEEGFDPYSFLPAAYDTGEEWFEAYIQNDPAVTTDLIGPDGKNSVGDLFPKFVEQYIADDGLSLEDMGVRKYHRKHQYNEWSDFPQPFRVAWDPLGIYSGYPQYYVTPVLKEDGLISTDSFKFSAIQFTVYDPAIHSDPTTQNYIRTQVMPVSQLLNRNFYYYRDGTNMGLVLDALDPQGTLTPVTPSGFATQDVAAAQEYIRADVAQDNLILAIKFYAFSDEGSTDEEYHRNLNEKGVTAIVINSGEVSDQMVDQLQRSFDDKVAASASDTELYGSLAYLAGQKYWKDARDTNKQLVNMHKIYEHTAYGVCLSHLIDDGAGYPSIPLIDVPIGVGFYVHNNNVNSTIHPDDPTVTISEGRRDFALMETANLSSHEHQAINTFYGVDNAVSTVRLLQIANRDFDPITHPTLPAEGYYEFTRSEFDDADTDPDYSTLKSNAVGMWDEARYTVGLDGQPSYIVAGWERIYITPYAISMDGPDATYTGMGLIATASDGAAALIEGSLNGGYGPLLPDIIDQINNGTLVVITDENGTRVVDPATLPPDNGKLGPAENNDSKDDINDPVDPVTGKLTINQVDLTLNGPFPLSLSRNYSSLNEEHNLFGYGWKINFMPFLEVAGDDSTILAADLNGTVVQYNLVPSSSPMRWEASTDPADNPDLDNVNGGFIGGQSNRFAAYIEKTTEGSDTVYTHYRANGHEARYIVTSYPIDLGQGTIQRTRPYLNVWEDAFGNTMTFTYYDDNTLDEYGQLRRIESSNGNFLVFKYNSRREITETFTNDGRHVYYSYDIGGDLREVRLPDNAVIKYDYKYLTDGSGDPYSTHLIERIAKPDGRVLVNTFDPSYDPLTPGSDDYRLRRVVSQEATVGDTLELVENAVYEYFKADDVTVTEPLAEPWTDEGYDVTLVHSDVRSQFGTLTTIYVHQDGLIHYVADPLAPGTFAPGVTDLDYVITYEYYGESETNGYPRSIKRMRNKRGLETLYEYDAQGNPTKITQRGDVTGDGVSEDVDTYYFYDATNRLPKKIIYPAQDGSGTNRVVFYNYPTSLTDKRDDDTGNPGYELYRFLPQNVVTYEVEGAAIDASTPGSSDEQSTVTYLYDHEEDLGDGTIAYGLLKSRQHQGADDADDKARTDYTHDGRGFITSTTEYTYSSDANVVTNYSYNDRGELVSITDPAGRVNRYDYDMLGRPTHMEKYTSASATNPAWWTYTHFNLNGEVTWVDGPRYGAEDYVFRDYDGAGRVIAEVKWRTEISQDGQSVQSVSGQNDWLGQSITYFDYDAWGNLTSVIDPRGNETVYEYDELGRLDTVTHPAVNSVVAEESYTYEPGGLVETYTNALDGFTTKDYTDFGALKTWTAPTVDGRDESWTYYLDGRVKSHVLSNNAVTTWIYDDAARTVSVETTKGGILLEKSLSTFDTRGNQIAQEVWNTDSTSFEFTYAYDGLSRLSESSGPPDQQRASPSEIASAEQTTTYSYTYSTSGDRYKVTATTAGEKRVSVFDGIGRPSREEWRDGSNTLDYQEAYYYSASHHLMQTAFGTNANDQRLVTVATNTFGQNIYTAYNDGSYTRRTYDKAGNLTESFDEMVSAGVNPRHTFTYDERNRLATDTKLDSSVTTFQYDKANNLVYREMPGGMIHHRVFDAALRLTDEYLEGSDTSTSRDVEYNYYTTGEHVGLLEDSVENLGSADQITHDYYYDDLLRLARYSCNGANYEGFEQVYGYDLRSYLTDVTRAPLNQSSGYLSTLVSRDIDGYGQILDERVYTGSGPADSFSSQALHSHIRQSWDGLGRRTRVGMGSDAEALGSTAPAFDYAYYAGGRIATITPNGVASDPWQVQYDYEDNNLLSERRFRVNDTYNARVTETLNRRLETGNPYRDLRGRLLRRVQTANGSPVLNESLAWQADSKLTDYTLVRGAGTGAAWNDFTDSRTHTYDANNRRLDTEAFKPEPGASTRTLDYDFDSDNLGVRISATIDTPASTPWEVNNPTSGGLDGFFRIVSEDIEPWERNFMASGSSTGPGVFELYVGEGSSPSSWNFVQQVQPDPGYGNGNWEAALSLPAGEYTLQARARPAHGDGSFEATSQSTFTVAAPDPRTVATTYDSHGRVKTRSWESGAVTQTFRWDAQGNLIGIDQVDSGTTQTYGSYSWTAQFDGFGRRIETEYAPEGATGYEIDRNRIQSWFDPQVEFAPLVVEYHGTRQWRIHGPDMDAGYGSFQAIGGLEAVMDETTGQTTPIVDTVHGHVVAHVDLGATSAAGDDSVVFHEAQYGGYGPLPGSKQMPLEFSGDLIASLGWQGRCIDPTGFYLMGARHYDPLSGRFLSADPLGHGVTPDLYSYADGDPINFLDPTGRFNLGAFAKGVVDVVVEPFAQVHDISLSVMIGVHNAVSDTPIYADDASAGMWSMMGQGQLDRLDRGWSKGETMAAGSGELLATVGTGGGYAVGKNIIVSNYQYETGQISLEQLDYQLSHGAGAQFGATLMASGTSRASGSGWTGRGVSNGELQQAAVNAAKSSEGRGVVQAAEYGNGEIIISQSKGVKGNSGTVNDNIQGLYQAHGDGVTNTSRGGVPTCAEPRGYSQVENSGGSTQGGRSATAQVGPRADGSPPGTLMKMCPNCQSVAPHVGVTDVSTSPFTGTATVPVITDPAAGKNPNVAGSH